MIGTFIKSTAPQSEGQCYRIKSLLDKQRGRRTFLAEETQTKTLVVLKLILFGPDFTWEDLKLFEREAETLKSLKHAAIPQYLTSFEAETQIGKGFVLVQTYIEATSLQQQVSAGRRFSEPDLKEIARSVLAILTYLHSQHPPVVHRDIKPSNLLLTDRTAHSCGRLYLVDFGSVQVAHHGGTMTVVGTYGYMPPEQFGGRASAASDLYSLGATLIYLATGQHPADFPESRLDKVISAHLNLSEGFTEWIRHLTRTELEDRIASAELALQHLKSAGPASSNVDEITVLPTAKPSVSLGNGTFKALSTKQSVTLRFYQDRIVEKLEVAEHIEQFENALGPRWTPVTSLWITALLFIVLPVLGLPFAICVLITIAAITGWFCLLFAGQHADGEYPGIVKMTLYKSPEGDIFLTLHHVLCEDSSSRKSAVNSLCATQFVDMPIESVTMEPNFKGYEAKFKFLSAQQTASPSLSIIGTQLEIKDLLDYIGTWD